MKIDGQTTDISLVKQDGINTEQEIVVQPEATRCFKEEMRNDHSPTFATGKWISMETDDGEEAICVDECPAG